MDRRLGACRWNWKPLERRRAVREDTADHGRGRSLSHPGLSPWSVGRQEGENRERGWQRRKGEDREGEKEQCGARGHTGGWQGQQDPGGKQNPSGWCHCRGSITPWAAGAERGRQACVDKQLCVQRSCPCTFSLWLACVRSTSKATRPVPAVASVSHPRCLAVNAAPASQEKAWSPRALSVGFLRFSCWRVKYQTPSGPQAPMASVARLSSLPVFSSLTFLLQFLHGNPGPGRAGWSLLADLREKA